MTRLLITMSAALCVVVAVTQAQTATAVKVASSWKCAPPNPVHMLPAGDAPDHLYGLRQGKCTATKGEIAGIAEKEGTPTEVMEVSGNTAKGHGLFVETLANGDKIYVNYEFTGTTVDKVLQSGGNKWTVIGGTGKFAGAKGSGSCTAKGNPDGSVNFDCTGSMTLAK